MNTPRLVVRSGRVATVALLALFVSSPAAAEICIDVALRFNERTPPRALVESMKKEAASIWESYGVRFEWAATTSLGRCEWAQASFEVLIDRDNPHPARSPKIVLGSTRLARRAVDHPIYIDRKAIRDLVESMPTDQLVRALGRPAAGPADVGRALGRVLAHEVGHVILNARDHQPRGLMRPIFLPDDLVRPRRDAYTLSADEVTRLRQRELDLNASPSAAHPVYDTGGEIPLTPRGETSEGFRTRTTWTKPVNAGASYRLRLGDRSLVLTADGFNIFNSQTTLDYDAFVELQAGVANPDFGTAGASGVVSGQQFATSRQFRIGVRCEF